MQVNLHNISSNQFTEYSQHSVTVNGMEYSQNIIVSQDNIVEIELKNIEDITIEYLTDIINQNLPDLIIFGTGQSIKMPAVNILHHLQKKHIGFEVMPVPALCRTFNYLVGEGRKVIAIILF